MAKGYTHDCVRNLSQEWYTPVYIFDALGIKFDLDPCSPGKKVVPWIPARTYYTIAEDGLTHLWHGRVWMNPPYSTQTIKWVKKLSEHGNGIGLVFARTDTQWFQKYAIKADVLCFMEGRIKFVNRDRKVRTPSGAGSVLMVFGEKCSQAVEQCGLGWIAKNGKY